MVVYNLKVNIAHLPNIEGNYFNYRNVFYRVLIASMVIGSRLTTKLNEKTSIEDCEYNKLFLELFHSELTLKEIFDKLNVHMFEELYLDLSNYIETFIERKYEKELTNIFNVEIVDKSHLVFKIKVLNI